MIALDVRPVVWERYLHIPQYIDRLVRLVRHRVRRFDSTSDFERAEQIGVVFRVAADNDHDATVVAARSPRVIVDVPAYGGRQAQAATKHVDRRSFDVFATGTGLAAPALRLHSDRIAVIMHA
jgi:hypothetical protein